MHLDLRRVSRLGLAAIALSATIACGDDSTDPGPISPDITVTATGATTARITFTGDSRNDGYIIQRASGAAGVFAAIDTVDAPASGSATVTFNDTGLTPNSVYRYQVAAIRGSQTSTFSAEGTITTLAPGSGGQVTLSGDITASRTLFADTTYLLSGFVHVTSGATLTVQAGTTIKGDFGTLGSSLFILPGARILAIGTETNPIVFTSSRNAGERQPGDWGGLIIIGRASGSRGETEIEGTGTATGTAPGTNYRLTYNGLATGAADTDDSGELRYVRVEYAGFAPSNGNELNSFTFATVGSGTKLSYLQSLNGLDDSFEFFGGTVDADHLVSYNSGDDHFDMSEGYRGRLQFLIALQDTVLPARAGSGGASGDPQGIENDGCGSTNCQNAATPFNSTPLTTPLVANFTLVGNGKAASSGGSGGVGMMIRRGVGGYYVNGLVARWPRACMAVIDAETYARAGSTPTPDVATSNLLIRNVACVETPVVFQTGTGRNAFDLTANSLSASAATTTSLFTAFPATVTATTGTAAFDWTPAAGSAGASGGLATFIGQFAARAAGATSTGLTITGTSYLGAAAPSGPKWWANWTRYGWQ